MARIPTKDLTAGPGLRLVQKARAFDMTTVRKSEGGVIPSEPVVSEDRIWLSCDGEMVALERSTLVRVLRARVGQVGPVEWSGDCLVLGGIDKAAVWDRKRSRILWRSKSHPGVEFWRDEVITCRDAKEVEFRNVRTGEIRASIPLWPPEANWGLLCGDTYIFNAAVTGDPVRALDLLKRRVRWTRNLQEEMRKQYEVVQETPGMGITCGSLPGRFILTRGTGLLGCSIEDGRILWHTEVYVPYHWPLVERGLIPVWSGWGRFVVVDEATGELRCERVHPELEVAHRWKRGSLWGGEAVFVSETGHVALFSLETAELLWFKKFPVAFWHSLVLDDRLLVTGQDGNIWVFERDTGQKRQAVKSAEKPALRGARAPDLSTTRRPKEVSKPKRRA